MARILARFTPEMVVALAKMSQFTDPGDTEFLASVLEGRLQKILDRYLTHLSSLTDVHLDGTRLCATDLAELRHVRPGEVFRYEARLGDQGNLPLVEKKGAQVCFGLSSRMSQQYGSVEIFDGLSRNPLSVSIYDRGPDGYMVAGLDRR